MRSIAIESQRASNAASLKIDQQYPEHTGCPAGNLQQRHLEDLSILKLADRTKRGRADNSPDYWAATTWLKDHWPESKTEVLPPSHKTPSREEATQGTNGAPSTALDTSQSHSTDDALDDLLVDNVRRVFPDAQIEVV